MRAAIAFGRLSRRPWYNSRLALSKYAEFISCQSPCSSYMNPHSIQLRWEKSQLRAPPRHQPGTPPFSCPAFPPLPFCWNCWKIGIVRVEGGIVVPGAWEQEGSWCLARWQRMPSAPLEGFQQAWEAGFPSTPHAQHGAVKKPLPVFQDALLQEQRYSNTVDLCPQGSASSPCTGLQVAINRITNANQVVKVVNSIF